MTAGTVPPPPGSGLPGDDPWDGSGGGVPERDWEPDDEYLAGYDDDPRADLTDAELAAEYAGGWDDDQAVLPDPDAAWYAAGCPDAGLAPGVSVFTDGDPSDVLGPGPLLAMLSDQAVGHGLAGLSDDALVGVLRSSRRLAAWQDGVELAAVAELDARRMAAAARPGWSRAGEHVSEELALALVLTGRSADLLLGLARGLARLPAVAAALLGGVIDRARAVVFAEETGALDTAAARAVADAFLPEAGSLTTRQLAARLRALILKLYPGAARQRAARARGDARVEAWLESSGNGALAGRELPAADMAAADARLTAIARALQAAGADGTLDQVRAAVYAALLLGRDPEDLLPPGPGTEDDDPGSEPAGRGRPAPGGAASAGTSGPVGHDPTAGPDPAAGRAGTSGPASAGAPAGKHSGANPPAVAGVPESGAAPAGAGLGLAALAGSVHLTLPATTWLGWSDAPGELPGYGPVGGWTARDLADRLAAHAATRWHVTLTGPDGRAAAHACPRTPPPPPAPPSPGGGGGTGPPAATGPPDRAGPPGRTGPPDHAGPSEAWLAGLRFDWLETTPCGHGRATAAYRPGAKVRELVTVRHRTCAFPGCRRAGRRCDADHTQPWEDGGLTCECNLAPLCRRHHRAKQGPGWTVTQPEPGTLIWTTPHGRRYTSTPDPYLT